MYFILAMLAIFIVSCADLNIEVQQTSRVNSAASRSPNTYDSDIQGSERTQSKNPVGIKANGKIAQ